MLAMVSKEWKMVGAQRGGVGATMGWKEEAAAPRRKALLTT